MPHLVDTTALITGGGRRTGRAYAIVAGLAATGAGTREHEAQEQAA
jgi:hypothetical protein